MSKRNRRVLKQVEKAQRDPLYKPGRTAELLAREQKVMQEKDAAKAIKRLADLWRPGLRGEG